MDENYLECPITKERIKEPVVDEYGYIYERDAIEAWMYLSNICPMTGTIYKNKTLKDYKYE